MDKKKATEFFQDDLQYLTSQTFTALCRGDNPKAFTRNRILNLKNLILSLFDRKARTLCVELDDVMEKLNPDESISRAGYHKRRMSLNHMALKIYISFIIRISTIIQMLALLYEILVKFDDSISYLRGVHTVEL